MLDDKLPSAAAAVLLRRFTVRLAKSSTSAGQGFCDSNVVAIAVDRVAIEPLSATQLALSKPVGPRSIMTSQLLALYRVIVDSSLFFVEATALATWAVVFVGVPVPEAEEVAVDSGESAGCGAPEHPASASNAAAPAATRAILPIFFSLYFTPRILTLPLGTLPTRTLPSNNLGAQKRRPRPVVQPDQTYPFCAAQVSCILGRIERTVGAGVVEDLFAGLNLYL
jgi:hypothetical protein